MANTVTGGVPYTEIGARPIPEFDGVHDVWPRGERLRAVREAALAYKARFKAQGQVRAVQSIDITLAPYPVTFGFNSAVNVPHLPMILFMNRMVVVQYDDWDGRPRTLVFEPTAPKGSAEAPFYENIVAKAGRLPGIRQLVDRLLQKSYKDPDEHLAEVGLSPHDVDFCTFDHLHVQDPRIILGSSKVIEGETAPRSPAFGDAPMLVHERELATLQSLHPMQWAWYVERGLDGVDMNKFITFDTDIELGPGIALMWTPGHTDGNHSLVVNTPDGVWVSSENGICLDNWQPELSKIPGVRRYAQDYGREICPNANTLEDSLDQYDSMIKEKTMADRDPKDPRWLQIQSSSELVPWKLFWPVVPTYWHGGLKYGEIQAGLK
ncbi:hypothetical protein [Mycobacterium sp. 1274756.6]|uniref:hypothetical protein n=1 Tax=Mycobacterium sp. 1274756.6 TaxID=1834076 RepID=UPI00080075BC|nr:hypothetical protein [Mycobacterium sp. 1274756.6]OBJ73821.1 hypothetical protein A5643_02655 [Mycobacterium sp. 1274756.6]